MPGIAGIIRKAPYNGVECDLNQMIETMRHEDFYQSGQYVRKDLGLYAGWAYHEASFADCMPLVSRNEDVVLIFHGENYLNDETLLRLRRSRSGANHLTAAYLIDLYEELGDSFFPQLNGWFCGLIANLRTREITLFNDRYGMSRIYFHEGKDEFLFASEAKSLLKIRGALRTLDPESLAEYLRFNCVTANKTLFRGISVLPNGSSWVFEDSVRPRKQRYFDPADWEQQPAIPANDFYEKFAETVTGVFPRYVRGSERIALALTAGFDSRLILAAVPNHDGLFSCCTYGGTWGETFDIGTAREIAKLQNQRFEVIRITQDFLKNFGGFAQRSVYLSDGTHDAFGAHDVYFNEITRKIAHIRLTGKFGSEVVRNRKLIPWVKYEKDFVQPDFKPVLDQLQPRDKASENRSLSNAVFEEIPWYEFGRVAVEQSQLVLRTPYLDNDLVKLMFQAPSKVRAAGEVQARYIKEKSPDLGAIQTNMGDLGNNNRFLTKLRYIFYRALFKTEFIYLYSAPHWLTRIDRKLERFKLERFFAGREKFEGYRIWIKTDLSEFIQESLLTPGAEYSRFLDRKSVENMVARHIAGTHNYLHEIGKALTIELVYSSLLKP
jgi:asparagine synthase (glutamine-hydrolysing)